MGRRFEARSMSTEGVSSCRYPMLRNGSAGMSLAIACCTRLEQPPRIQPETPARRAQTSRNQTLNYANGYANADAIRSDLVHFGAKSGERLPANSFRCNHGHRFQDRRTSEGTDARGTTMALRRA